MIEEEAKTKACFRAATFGGSQQLADGPGPNCIASACMAWRWSDGESEMFAVHVPKADLKGSPAAHAPGPEWSYVGPHQHNSTYVDNNHYWFKRAWADGKRSGFCGLAGAPQ